jgi:hypothetical protein
MLVDGVIQSSEFTGGVGGSNPQQVTLLTGPFLISTTFGVNPISNTAWRWANALNNQTYIEVGTQTLLEKRNLVTPDNATNFPDASDVRSGTAYGIGGVVFGTCVVPNPAQVAAGTPVDNTVGTLSGSAPTAAEVASAVWGAESRTLTSASGPTAVQIRQEIDSNSTQLAAIKSTTDALNPTRLANVATVEITGAQLAAALTAP